MSQENSHAFDPPYCHARGFCAACNRFHELGMGTALRSAQKLILQMDKNESIDLFSDNQATDRSLLTAPLWGEPRGKMFGVLDCLTADNSPLTLYAFSGQYHGRWRVPGWVPPVFDVDCFHETTHNVEKEIKTLGHDIANCLPHSDRWLALRKKRRTLSRNLMAEIHTLYKLRNFKGELRQLTDVFYGSDRIPTGTGDCCAPKLLNFAAGNNLTPTGICEFFYGRRTKSGSHSHGQFSSSCQEKCEPILGFMLCGLHND